MTELAKWKEILKENPELAKTLIPKKPLYCPHTPTAKQAAFLLFDSMEVLYGGAAGGGKSEAILMAALQFVDEPEYAAIIIRRSLKDLALPGAIMDRTQQWFADQPIQWDTIHKKWTFPSGATLSFGYMDRPNDKYRYQSTEFQFIGFDELTQFEETEYTFLFSRLRKTAEMNVPLRMRAASNPGGIGHDWVKERFIRKPKGAVFVPANLTDNEHIDAEEYKRSLANLDSVTRAQLLIGDWDSEQDGILTRDQIEACYAQTLWPEDAQLHFKAAEIYIGIDIGRTKNLTVIWTWEKIGDVLWAREIKVLEKTSFATQKREIQSRISSTVVKIVIDKGGIGLQLAEELESDYPAIAEGVQLTPGTQARIANRMAIEIDEKRVRLPENKEMTKDLLAVRKTRRVGGIDKIESAVVANSHADRFWAAALGLEAAIAVNPTIKVSMPRIQKRNRKQ